MADKTFDAAVAAAFRAGAEFGAKYPEFEAIPEPEIAIRAAAFRDGWAGDPWPPGKYGKRRAAAYGLTASTT